MATYVVAYDLNNEKNRPNIVGEVRKTGWARLSESSYAIDTTERPSQVLARFRKYLDDDDYLYVISLTRPWSAYGLKDVIAWLQQRLGAGE